MALHTTRRHWPLALAGLWSCARASDAMPAEVQGTWPGARLIGSGRLRVLGLHVYDAQLWSPEQPTPTDWPAQPFALVLTYARALAGADIVDRSLDEMARQAPLEPAQAERWRSQLQATFGDVRRGDRLSGLHRPGQPATFVRNGAPVAQWDDPRLARRFFGIWLSERTSDRALREALFGGRG